MLNLFRMNLRSVFRDKGVYICLGVIFLIVLIGIGTMKMVVSAVPEGQESAAEEAEDGGVAVKKKVEFAGMNLGMEFEADDVKDAREFQNMSQTEFIGNLLFSGGLMAALMAVFGSTVICGDFTSGVAKNIFSYHAKRGKYVVSKLFTMAVVSAFYMTALVLLTLLAYKMMGMHSSIGDVKKLLLMLTVGWFCLLGHSAQNLLFCILTGNAVVSSILSVACGIGAAAGILNFAASYLGFQVVQFLPAYNLMSVVFISGKDVRITSGLMSFVEGSQEPNAVLAIATALIWAVFYVVVSDYVLKKKDIC